MKKFLTTAFLFTLAAVAFAQGAPVAAQKSLFEGQFVAHLSLAIAAAGCGLGQGKAVVAACEGVARNPQAAGAIPPQDGFRYAFESGADFVCCGMYDFQIVEDINLANKILSNIKTRPRPWRG